MFEFATKPLFENTQLYRQVNYEKFQSYIFSFVALDGYLDKYRPFKMAVYY